MTDKVCDVVLDGGGVKGIGLVGALSELEAAGYSFRRVAGTSAGSIVGSLLAAGWTSADLIELMKTVDYTQFRDRNFLGYFGWPGEGLSLILTKGLYRGNYLRDWLGELLAQKGVRTFADLRLHEPWANGLWSLFRMFHGADWSSCRGIITCMASIRTNSWWRTRYALRPQPCSFMSRPS
jgi:NTE family protein